MKAFVHRYIGNEKVEEAFARICGYAAEVGYPDVDELTRVFVQDRVTCKCGCILYRVTFLTQRYMITPKYLLTLAEKGKIKNREYEVKTSEAGRKYVDVKYMKHIKSKWTFAQYAGREVITDFPFSYD